MVALGLSLSQKDPALHPGRNDIDDCWVVAALQSGRAVGADIKGIDIPKFRKAAGRPDDPGKTNPGGAADVLRGANVLWPKLRIKLSSTKFDTFWASLRQGWVAVILIDSSKLPADIRYGFNGLHAATARLVITGGDNETCYEINPLQPKGTRAKTISKATLKAALMGYPRAVQAVLFAPAPVPAPKPPEPGPTPPIVDPTPYSQEDLDDAREAGRIAGVQSVIEEAEKLI